MYAMCFAFLFEVCINMIFNNNNNNNNNNTQTISNAP